MIRGKMARAATIAVALAAALGIAPKPAMAKQFPDVPTSHWAYQVVDEATDKGIMNGFPSGNFGPEETTTRAQVAAMLHNASGDGSKDMENHTGLWDVKENEWYTPSINWAVSNKVFNGSNGKFRPDDPITREELCAVLRNYAAIKGMDQSYDADRMLRYPDASQVSSWALESVRWAVENSIVGGGGSLNPAGNAKRCETAKMVLLFTKGGEKRPAVLKSHFINVGQGDSELIQLGSGQNVLIDAGTAAWGGNVVSYLRGLGITRLDYVVMTHPDADHIGGMKQVIESFEVGKIYAPNVGSTSKTWENLLDAIAAKGLKITEAKAGVTLVDDGELSVSFVSPRSIVSGATNENSAITWLDYGGKTFCYTGDADAADITATAPGHVDVLKVSHHGSNTGTSAALVSKLTPSAAVISVGAGNSYGHPTSNVLSLLAGAAVYRTDKQGDITAYCDTDAVWFSTSPAAPEPQPEPQPQPDPQPQPQPDPQPGPDLNQTVYATKTGKKYHYSWCPTIQRSKNLRSMTAAQALGAGLGPCKVCNPPA